MNPNLVQRLRESDGYAVVTGPDGGPAVATDIRLLREAADAIEGLQDSVERLQRLVDALTWASGDLDTANALMERQSTSALFVPTGGIDHE